MCVLYTYMHKANTHTHTHTHTHTLLSISEKETDLPTSHSIPGPILNPMAKNDYDLRHLKPISNEDPERRMDKRYLNSFHPKK